MRVENYKGLYSKTPAYIYGFHGCRRETYERVLFQNMPLPKSTNEYDWLGHGIYFWENSYERAVEWARSHYGDEGMVIGAFIDLGYCLDLTDYGNMDIIKNGYTILEGLCKKSNIPMPTNRSGGSRNDLLVRNLDCAVIQIVHATQEEQNRELFDSVRGIFEEGAEVYPGSGFKEKTHTQVCIVNPNCIKGYFMPKEVDAGYKLP